MQTQLDAVKKVIDGETIETSHLKVARSLFQQLVVRWGHHQETAQRITEERAKAKAAEIEAAAKVVQQAEQEKANAAAQLAQSEAQAAQPSTE